jgi:hypothetical protein
MHCLKLLLTNETTNYHRNGFLKEIMPDITMCTGGDCPAKETCYRFKATPSEYRQSFFTKPPWNFVNGCEHYWPVVAKSQVKRINIQTGK